MDQTVEGQRDCGLETYDSEWCIRKIQLLLVGMVRFVVGDDRIHRPVVDGLENGFDIRRTPQRRVGLPVWVVIGSGHVLVGEYELVRRHLATHRQPTLFRSTNQIESG